MRDLDALPVTFHHEVPVVGGEHTVLDNLNRPMWDLRISVMDQCNLRCSYCTPADSGPFNFGRALGSITALQTYCAHLGQHWMR